MINRVKDRKTLIAWLMMVMICFPIFVSASRVSYFNEDMGNQIDLYLSDQLSKAKVPGATIAIVDEEGIIFSKVYGDAQSIDSPFIIGSLSKSVTALAVMQLVTAGKIDLDAHVADYLGDSPFIGSDLAKGMKVRELLHQTSGIGENQQFPIETLKGTVGSFEYSDANYNLLGKIIESVTGMSFEVYLKENIFNPLQMQHTYTSLEEAKANGLLQGHRNYFGVAMPQDVTYEREAIPSSYIISSSSDLAQYMQMYLKGGSYEERSLVSTESISMMQNERVSTEGSRATADLFGNQAEYGMGWIYKNLEGEKLLYHGGKAENYASHMSLLPDRKLGIVMLFNTGDYLVGQGMLEQIEEGVISMVMGKAPKHFFIGEYYLKHLLIDAVCILTLILAFIPLLKVGKWKEQFRVRRTRRGVMMLKAYILHLIIPIIMILLPVVLGVPYQVLNAYIPDVAYIYYSCIVLFILPLLIKMQFAHKQNKYMFH